MGALILVFLILGVGGGGRLPDLFRGTRPDAVAVAGSHSLDSRDFRRIYEQQKTRLEEQTKQTYTSDFLVQNGFDQQLLNDLALDQAFTEMLARAGVSPGPALVDAEIKKLPWAFDRVTGKFSERQFTQALAQQGVTPREAQAEFTDELAQRHFTYAIEAGFRVPRTYAALNALAGLENRDVSFFVLDPRVVPQPSAPTDAELVLFMREHAAQITRPEMRVITIARFSAKALEPTVTVDDAAIAKEFTFRKESLSTPERRTVIQIPVKTTAQGAAVTDRLGKGEDPAVIANSMGVQPITYADQPLSAIADRKIAATAFAMKPGEVKGPVQGDLGIAVIDVVKVAPGSEASLATSRSKIEADLRAKMAADKAYELSQKFDDTHQAGANVADAARQAGVTAITVGPVTAGGLDTEGKPNPLLTDKILKSAFSRNAGEDTDIEDAGPGEYFALKVDKVIPPALPPLDEIKPQLTRAYMSEKFLQALKGKANVLMDLMRNGATIDQVAAQVGAHVVRQTGMQRISAEKFKAMGRDFLEGVFTAKPKGVFAAPALNGVFIGRIDAVRPGDVAAMARVTEAIRGQLAQDYLRDMMSSVKSAARQDIKVTVNLNLARQAIGVDPAQFAKTAGKPGPAAK
jgi:peptidyl-prolyl cis-trans isomerase D